MSKRENKQCKKEKKNRDKNIKREAITDTADILKFIRWYNQ